MKITDEVVEAALGEWMDHEFDSMKDAPRMRAALEAALPHLSQGAVSVKPLEWKVSGLRMFVADTEIGQYAISRDPYSAGGYFNLWMAGADEDTSSEYPSLPEAEAAAQADYERRTLSPAPVGVMDGVNNAASDLLASIDPERLNPEQFNAWSALAAALASHEPAPTDTQEGVSEAGEWRDEAAEALIDEPRRTENEALPSGPDASDIFGYWCKHKYADGCLLKPQCYIPEPSDDMEVIPLVRQSALTACQQEVERLRGEKRDAYHDGYASRDGVVNACRKRAEAAEARIRELVKAIEELCSYSDEEYVPNTAFAKARAAARRAKQ